MAQADRSSSSNHNPAQPGWRFSVDAKGFEKIVRLSGAMRALGGLCWDGEADNESHNPHIGRSDLTCLIGVLGDALDDHVQNLSCSMGEA